MSDDDLVAEIIELAKDHTGAKDVTATTRLYSDLGMTGDDAHEFLLAFAIKYDVDMGSMIWLRYFGDEGVDMLSPALALGASILSPSFAVRWQAAHDAEREVTIAHLAEVARAKVWSDPGEAFRPKPRSAPLGLIFSAISVVVTVLFFLLGLLVSYAFLTGRIGEQNPLALLGIALTSLFFPAYFVWLGWLKVREKLASA